MGVSEFLMKIPLVRCSLVHVFDGEKGKGACHAAQRAEICFSSTTGWLTVVCKGSSLGCGPNATMDM